MHRTIKRCESRIETLDGPGIHILTHFTDAERGLVSAPAASLLAADLTRRLARDGRQERVSLHLAPPGSPPPGATFAIMYSASFLQHNGSAVGFALAADAADPDLTEFASAVVREWSAALRSRHLLVAGLDTSCHTATDELPRDTTEADLMLALAHGSCPRASATLRDLRAFAARGDTVVVIGDPDDPATRALTAAAPSATLIVGEPAQVPTSQIPEGRPVSFVVSPSCPAGQAFGVLKALRERFRTLRGHHFDALCTTATDHAEAIGSVCATADLMVIGARSSQDGGIRAISSALRSAACPVRVVTGPEQLDIADLTEATTIGLARTPAAAPELTTRIIRSLSGLGPLTARLRSVGTTDLPAWDSGSREADDGAGESEHGRSGRGAGALALVV